VASIDANQRANANYNRGPGLRCRVVPGQPRSPRITSATDEFFSTQKRPGQHHRGRRNRRIPTGEAMNISEVGGRAAPGTGPSSTNQTKRHTATLAGTAAAGTQGKLILDRDSRADKGFVAPGRGRRTFTLTILKTRRRSWPTNPGHVTPQPGQTRSSCGPGATLPGRSGPDRIPEDVAPSRERQTLDGSGSAVRAGATLPAPPVNGLAVSDFSRPEPAP